MSEDKINPHNLPGSLQDTYFELKEWLRKIDAELEVIIVKLESKIERTNNEN
jgi:hypothetical protein